MKKLVPFTWSCFVPLALGYGCGGGVPPSTDPPPIDTDSDGIYTSGIDGNGDGADDTAGPPPAVVLHHEQR